MGRKRKKIFGPHTGEKKNRDGKYFEKENILSVEKNKQDLLPFLVSKVLLNQKEAFVIHLSVPLAICHLSLSYKKGN